LILPSPKHERRYALAAKAAAPYVHARLQAVTLGGDPENPIKVDNMSELGAARRLAFLLTKAAADAA
jgi:hypothetical protein